MDYKTIIMSGLFVAAGVDTASGQTPLSPTRHIPQLTFADGTVIDCWYESKQEKLCIKTSANENHLNVTIYKNGIPVETTSMWDNEDEIECELANLGPGTYDIYICAETEIHYITTIIIGD